MKVLLTVHQFLPEYFSGTEILTYSVAKALRKRGHEAVVFAGYPARSHMPDDDRFDQYETDGIRVHRFQHAYVPMGDQNTVTELEYDNHLTAQHFSLLLEKEKPDAIHFFHLSRLGGGLIDVAVKARIPSFSTPTDFWSVCPTSQLLLKDGSVCAGPSRFGGNCVRHVAALTRGPAVQRMTAVLPNWAFEVATRLTASDALPRYPLSNEVAAMARRRPFLVERLNWLNQIVSPTKLMTRVLTENGVDPGRITESAYGIDMQAYDTEPVTVEDSAPVILGFIGTLAKHKGCHVLISAVKQLPQSRVRLKIYGKPTDFPEYYEHLQSLAAGAANIEFCGSFPNSDVARVLGGLDALVVPSLWYENTPLVVYSALAARRPVIASNFAGLAEAVHHHVNGMLFAPGNVNDLMAKLSDILAQPERLHRWSLACQKPKSSEEYCDELLDIYQRHSTAPAANPRSFPPRQDKRGFGFISGWAVLNAEGPTAVTATIAGQVIGSTQRFLPRPDVADGLRRAGIKVANTSLGFAIAIERPFERDQVTLVVHGSSGNSVSFSLSTLSVGASQNVTPGCIVGLDQEKQPTPVPA